MSSRILIIFVATCAFLTGSAGAQENTDWRALYSDLLKRYVTPAGVKYSVWKASAADLQKIDRVVNAIGAASLGGLNKEERLAFYLDAYNAWILHEALEKYPTKSVKDTFFTFFTGKRIRVAGEEMSFNHLEKEIILKRFNEPRVHFALNCASQSCPPLAGEPFRPQNLEQRLEKVARAYINSARGVRVVDGGRTAQLSKIFDWYKEDFPGGVVSYINKYLQKPLPPTVKVTYQDYDWGLNEVK